MTTESGESFPWTKSPFEYDVICSAPASFSSCFLENVEFYNFQLSYKIPGGKECGSNSVFRNHHSAASASAGTYLTKVKCTNCD